MTKFRTNTRDIAPPIKKERRTPGELPDSRIPIYDANGNRRGHVGRLASSATCNRFGVPDAELKMKNGRVAWVGKGSK